MLEATAGKYDSSLGRPATAAKHDSAVMTAAELTT